MNDNPTGPAGHVENTTLRDPVTHIAGARSAGSSADYITDMEAAGRQQLAESDLMPAKGDWAELEQLGFVNRGPVPDDPIFVHADIPAGWRRDGLRILDERGLARVEIAYKAAFYDRGATVFLTDPIVVPVRGAVMYDRGELSLPTGWDVFTPDERTAVRSFLENLISGEAERRNPHLFANEDRRTRVLSRAEAMLTLIGQADTQERT